MREVLTNDEKRTAILAAITPLGVTEMALADGVWTLSHPSGDIEVNDAEFDNAVHLNYAIRLFVKAVRDSLA